MFARQNLISDPPFSRMDLISCRNVMIYLEPSLQKKALPAFHYALKPEGFPVPRRVGVDRRLHRPVRAGGQEAEDIFAESGADAGVSAAGPDERRGERAPRPPRRRSRAPRRNGRQGVPEGVRGELNAEREADRVTVNQFAPPGVLINADLHILQFRGPTGAYLEPPTGKASFDLLKMAREGLMLPLRAAINLAEQGEQDRPRGRTSRSSRTARSAP